MNADTGHPTSASQGEQRPNLAALVRMVTAAAKPKNERQPTRSAPPSTAATNTMRKAHGQQVRLRLSPTVALQLRDLPARARAEVIALVTNAALAKVPIVQLVGYRQELKNLGLLLNQSLRVSSGRSVNVEAVARVGEVISRLIQR